MCKRQGLKAPIIEELNNQFRLTLYSKQAAEITLHPWGKVLLEYLKEEHAISAKLAMQLWQVAGRTTRMRLKQLQEEGIIVRIGTSESDPNASYILTKKFLILITFSMLIQLCIFYCTALHSKLHSSPTPAQALASAQISSQFA